MKTIEVDVKFVFNYDMIREEALGVGRADFFDKLTPEDYGNLTLKDIASGMQWEIDRGIVSLKLGNVAVVEDG